MHSNVRYVGLDVHKRVVEACILDHAGKVVFRCRFDNLDRHTLAAFARRHLRKTDRVALEASTNTWTVVDILRPFVAEVVVSNPMQTKAIAQAKVKRSTPGCWPSCCGQTSCPVFGCPTSRPGGCGS